MFSLVYKHLKNPPQKVMFLLPKTGPFISNKNVSTLAQISLHFTATVVLLLLHARRRG